MNTLNKVYCIIPDPLANSVLMFPYEGSIIITLSHTGVYKFPQYAIVYV